jgi:hypothetical protein
MLIELYRKLTAEESADVCAICGNDHDIDSVYALASGDRGEDLGSLCPTCLDYLNRRKNDSEDPTLDNWPSCDWPTVEVLRRL